ncbi:hypothetical protein TELCIR_24916 [Teladorsagia circumcincta]|uniref:Uncharacterized protein n=1 Tax=Teladorsagia circumcincta TaxID=45464 RepID=A0A2G9T787_TELCI|nr:hypothetical protein TELCIR_24916 [Teladorsagia circumcincta]
MAANRPEIAEAQTCREHRRRRRRTYFRFVCRRRGLTSSTGYPALPAHTKSRAAEAVHKKWSAHGNEESTARRFHCRHSEWNRENRENI